MEFRLTNEEKQRIETGIRRKYVEVASSVHGKFRYPTGREGLEKLEYDPDLISALPKGVLESYCGVGNPFSLEQIHEGESVLDIGCGAGVDTLIAGMLVGPDGRSVGIDLVHEMVGRATINLRNAALPNVVFVQASGESLPFSDRGFDVILSNGSFNLIPEKRRAAREAFRILKPGGRLMIADNFLAGQLPEDKNERVAGWAK